MLGKLPCMTDNSPAPIREIVDATQRKALRWSSPLRVLARGPLIHNLTVPAAVGHQDSTRSEAALI